MKTEATIDLQGYWWLPDNQEEAVPGRLRVSSDGGVSLELLGSFGAELFSTHQSLPVVNGTLENGKKVTLCECVYKHHTVRLPGISTSELYANQAFIGHHLTSRDDLSFSKAYFHFEGLDKWLGLTGIHVEHATDLRSATITFAPPEQLEFQITETLKLGIEFSWSMPSLYGNIESAAVSQKAMLSLEPATPLGFEQIVSLVYRINCFLCLGINEPSSLTDLRLQKEGIVETIGETSTPARIDAYYRSLPQSKASPKQLPFGEMFTYQHIRQEFPRYLARWLENYERIQPGFDLYFAATTADIGFLESRFLFLVQGLETLHRRTIGGSEMEQAQFEGLVATLVAAAPADLRQWLSNRLHYANEPSLRKRLRAISDILAGILGEQYRGTFPVGGIVDTRNYFTHYDPSLESQARIGGRLYPLIEVLEATFAIVLMHEAGFSDELIRSIFEHNRDVKRKFTRQI